MTVRSDNPTRFVPFPLLALVLAAFVLAACGTVEGAGRDIQTLGGAIGDAADDASERESPGSTAN
jgi:predicted small secreted protein